MYQVVTRWFNSDKINGAKIGTIKNPERIRVRINIKQKKLFKIVNNEIFNNDRYANDKIAEYDNKKDCFDYSKHDFRIY